MDQTAYKNNFSFYCLACIVDCRINKTRVTEAHADSKLFILDGNWTRSLSDVHAYLPGIAVLLFYSVLVFAFKKRSLICRRDAAEEQFSSTQAT